jgi:sialic acid synthase SpsE
LFSIKDIDFVATLCDDIKIPSPESYQTDLVNACIERFNTVFMSVGASKPEEYERWAKYDNVVLLHCVSSYPCNMERVNLPKLEYLKTLTDNVGYSGHLQRCKVAGPSAAYDAIAAIVHGAKVIEKHFTIDNNLPGRDNKFALLPHEFIEIKRFADVYDNMMVDRGLDIQECELDYRCHQKGRWNN